MSTLCLSNKVNRSNLGSIYDLLPRIVLEGREADTLYFENNLLSIFKEPIIKLFLKGIKYTSIQKLYLGNNFLGLWGEDLITEFGKQLAASNITHIYLNNNYLSKLGTTKFGLLLTALSQPKIKKIDLSNNKLSELGIPGLIYLENLTKNYRIKSLNLAGNNFNYIQKEYLENCFFKEAMPPNMASKLTATQKENLLKVAIKKYASLLPKSEVQGLNESSTATKFFSSIIEIINFPILKIKKYIDQRNFYLDLEAALKDKTGAQHPSSQTSVEKILIDLRKNLFHNRQKREGTPATLKNLCLFSIKTNQLMWKEASLPIELKEDIAETNFGLKI